MGFHLSFGWLFQLSLGQQFAADPDLVIGPLRVYLGWNSAGLVWEGRFDFIIETSDYRPEDGRWFETWRESQDTSGGYVFGRVWRKVDLRASAGDGQQGAAGAVQGTSG